MGASPAEPGGLPFVLVLAAIGDRPLGVVCASSRAIDDRVLSQCGIEPRGRLRLTEMSGQREFDQMLAGSLSLDVSALEHEVVTVVEALLAHTPDLGAIMLQCSDLCPFSHTLQERFELPVYDAVGLVLWLHQTLDATCYSGRTRTCLDPQQ